MSGRSVIETLDLHNDYGEYHTESCASQNYGWLSPRISFSADFTGFSSSRLSPEKRKMFEGEAQAHQQQHQQQLQNSPPSPSLSSTTSSTDFEFSLSSFNIPGGGGSPGFIVPADELFHQGKLLPGFISPLSSTGAREDAIGGDGIAAESSSDAALLPEIPVGCPTSTIARHMTTTEGPAAAGGPSSLGCVLGPSCLRTPRGPKWRELFGALRRVKSDSGRQRIPDESLLPPKTLQGRRRFFKQLFSSTGTGGQQSGAPGGGAGGSHYDLDRAADPLPSSRRPTTTSEASSTGLLSASQERSTAWDSSPTATATTTAAAARVSAGRSAAHLRHKAAAAPSANSPEPQSGAQFHAQQAQTPSTDGRGGMGGDQKVDSRGAKTGDQSSEGFTFNPTPGPGRARTSGGGGSSGTGGGRLISPIRGQSRGGTLGRSPSGRVIVRGLDRVASGRTPALLQEQIRALRSREIRRSPDRSGYSSVRVTPVLNVPVCMGPVLRGATKAGKGRLSNFRSLLNFKSKLPTSMSTPMVTRVD